MDADKRRFFKMFLKAILKISASICENLRLKIYGKKKIRQN